MEKSIPVTLHYSDAGSPLFVPGERARLVLDVHEGSSASDGVTVRRHIELAGNRQGLVSLAAAILALAESSEDHHLHLDDLSGEAVRSAGGYELLIERLPDRKR